jgi:hypothetical protein
MLNRQLVDAVCQSRDGIIECLVFCLERCDDSQDLRKQLICAWCSHFCRDLCACIQYVYSVDIRAVCAYDRRRARRSKNQKLKTIFSRSSCLRCCSRCSYMNCSYRNVAAQLFQLIVQDCGFPSPERSQIPR